MTIYEALRIASDESLLWSTRQIAQKHFLAERDDLQRKFKDLPYCPCCYIQKRTEGTLCMLSWLRESVTEDWHVVINEAALSSFLEQCSRPMPDLPRFRQALHLEARTSEEQWAVLTEWLDKVQENWKRAREEDLT